MDIEWDSGKGADNLRKHGVDFADAVIALEDDNALTIEDTDHDATLQNVGNGSKYKHTLCNSYIP